MILVRSVARGANGVQDMIVLTLLATQLSVQDSATGGVPLLAQVTQAAARAEHLWLQPGSAFGWSSASNPSAERRRANAGGLCDDKLSKGWAACPRVREKGRHCGGAIVRPQHTREPGLTRVDAPQRERDVAAGRPWWHMLWRVDVGGTTGVLRGAGMMALCRQGARQEHRDEE
jgi:hypothetical protein